MKSQARRAKVEHFFVNKAVRGSPSLSSKSRVGRSVARPHSVVADAVSSSSFAPKVGSSDFVKGAKKDSSSGTPPSCQEAIGVSAVGLGRELRKYAWRSKD